MSGRMLGSTSHVAPPEGGTDSPVNASRPVPLYRDSRIERKPIHQIKEIQTLLKDVYKDTGDGRTLVRELIQNADDAKAGRLVMAVVREGWSDATNGLLRGAALVVANDGPFPESDRTAMHQAMGGSKAEDVEKVGRFGVGLKSLFHLCEAFVYLGADSRSNTVLPGALNPWAGTGSDPFRDPWHSDWDEVKGIDLNRLQSLAHTLLGGFTDGLLLWIPLRASCHLDRFGKKRIGLGDKCWSSEDMLSWFDRPDSIALLMAQCAYLASVEVFQIASAWAPLPSEPIARVMRPEFSPCSWVGRPKDDVERLERHFSGTIHLNGATRQVTGMDVVGPAKLRELRSRDDWPRDISSSSDQMLDLPMKALAHAAISLLLPHGQGSRFAVRVRWAVFLPLDDAPAIQTSSTIEFAGNQNTDNVLDIVLHGYFWPSHDRRSIPGVVGTGVHDEDLRAIWNRTLRDELLLPLFPKALERSLAEQPLAVAQVLIGHFSELSLFKKHKKAITRKHILLPTIQEMGVRWSVFPSSKTTALAIPNWSSAAQAVRLRMAALSTKYGAKMAFIDRDTQGIYDPPSPWSDSHFEAFLDCIGMSELRTERQIDWARDFVQHVIGSSAEANDARAAVVARWFVARVSEGSLTAPTSVTTHDKRNRWEESWRNLAATLPSGWLLSAPKASHDAVKELAQGKVIGPGLIPIPLGISERSHERSLMEPTQIARALRELGRCLSASTKTSVTLRTSRLILSETLISAAELSDLNSELLELPLLRVKKYPESKEEAWSISELRFKKGLLRAFCGPWEEYEESVSSEEVQRDHTQAVTDLCRALGEPVWLVMSPKVARFVGVTQPTVVSLADSVNRANSFSSDPLDRCALIKRLGSAQDASNRRVLRALFALLACYSATDDEFPPLYYVRPDDSNRESFERCLELLVRLWGRPWAAVTADLVNPLPHGIVQALNVRAVDLGVLHSLLDKCLQTECDFSQVALDDAVHLLKHLFSTNDAYRDRWRSMPLHRLSTGGRSAIDAHTSRAAGRVELPHALAREVRIVEPDSSLESLYSDIPILDDDRILAIMLDSTEPWRFADMILRTLTVESGKRVVLPRRTELLERLKGSRWLPLKQDWGGAAPETLLLLPQELEQVAAQLASTGALGGRHLVGAFEPKTWHSFRGAVQEILRNPTTSDLLQLFSEAIDLNRMGTSERDKFLILPTSAGLDGQVLRDALQTSLCNQHPGWALLKTVASVLEATSDATSQANHLDSTQPLLAVARKLCGHPSPSGSWVPTLKELSSTRPGKESPAGRYFRYFIEACAKDPQFSRKVLPYIELPTQDGQWHNPAEIARSANGVARRHRLVEELRGPLGLRSDTSVAARSASNQDVGAPSTADRLKSYCEKWKNRVGSQAVGAFLSLLGDQNEGVSRLAQEWLGEDVSVAGVRNALVGPNALHMDQLKLFVSRGVVSGARVETDNLLGQVVNMEAGTDSDTIFAFDPVLNQSQNGPFWSITLRDIEPARKTSHDLTNLLKGTVEWWARYALRVPPQNIQTWWSAWGTGSQAQLDPVRASILAHLPLILHQLDVREHSEISDALRKAQHAQRMREQAQPNKMHEANTEERVALNVLASIIEKSTKNQAFVWGRVQEQMKRFGYGQDSVLLELLQNADDALVQAEELAGRTLPEGTRSVTVRVQDTAAKSTTVDFLHYGRPINSTGGAAFPEGRRREWDQDLYFMLVLNLSGKAGETPGKSSPSATTGQFGLGFKSVHLVSDSPSVVSGFLAFSIAGGLLPKEHPKADDTDLSPVEGHQPTRIRLPLRGDEDSVALRKVLFNRFGYAQTLVPAFARAISTIVVEGGPNPGVSRFHGMPLKGAPGWSVSADSVSLPRAGLWHLLRFRPGDVSPQYGTEAFVVGLCANEPKPFPADVPFLWSVTPTSEVWGCGYAVNGPFKLDPGRTHVSLDNPTTSSVADSLGVALGEALIKLHDAFEAVAQDDDSPIGQVKDTGRFLSRLWEVLATGLDSPDQLRSGFLRRLHGPGRGVSRWMSARSVVPTGLQHPFAPKLPKLSPEFQFEEAGSAFDDPVVINALTQMDELAAVAAERRVVSRKIARLLKPLVVQAPSVCQPGDLLQSLAEKWRNQLTSQRLHSLRPLADETVFRTLQSSPNPAQWSVSLLAMSKAGNDRPLRRLLIPLAHGLEASDPDILDELARAGFAEDGWILAPAYLEQTADVKLFRRLRGTHEVDARAMAQWCGRIPEGRRDAALRYILNGKLGNELVGLLVPPGQRPAWLQSYDEVARRLATLGAENWRTLGLLARLFPERFQQSSTGAPPTQGEPRPPSSGYMQTLLDWWKDDAVRSYVLNLYEQKAWPEFLRRDSLQDGLRAGSREHWLGLLILGACRGLGRATEEQHRSFLEWTHTENWWEVFQEPGQQSSWMEKLEEWQDNATANLKWGRWMSLFPTIFQLSRCLDTYKRLLMGAGRRPADYYIITKLLAPKVDEKLSGAGAKFDAPPAPLNMGLHWVLRELVRLKVIDGTHLYPDCWVPSQQLLRFMAPYGMVFPDPRTSNAEKAKCIAGFLTEHLAEESPTFLHAFDIPLLYVAGNASFEIGSDVENDT